MKIVINSHIDYKKPREKLFDSLEKTGWQKYIDVILILSGSKNNSYPHIEDKIVKVYSDKNNYDYNAYDVLYLHQNHALIKDDFYLYLHDTVTFEKDFLDKFSYLNDYLKNKSLDTILINNGFHSNICVIGSNVINNYKNNFSQFVLTKKQAVELETKYQIKKENKTMFNIIKFGLPSYVKERVYVETSDIYDTGFLRECFLYSKFGIFKWVCWGYYGDILYNKLIPNKI